MEDSAPWKREDGGSIPPSPTSSERTLEMIEKCAKHQLECMETERVSLLREAGCISFERMPYVEQEALELNQADLPPEGSWTPL